MTPSRFDVLGIEDFGLSPLTDSERNDLLELLDDRCPYVSRQGREGRGVAEVAGVLGEVDPHRRLVVLLATQRIAQDDRDTFGVFAEQFARFMGTAQFLIAMTVFVVFWVGWNTLAPQHLRYDNYPFIFLTLMLSLDPATVGKQGYSHIFQIGEAFEGKALFQMKFYALAIWFRRDAQVHARWMVCTVFPIVTPVTASPRPPPRRTR